VTTRSTSISRSNAHGGDTATIGFWQNKNGQALINNAGAALVPWQVHQHLALAYRALHDIQLFGPFANSEKKSCVNSVLLNGLLRWHVD
jgi:uncharacterized protein (UPF0548 family)